MIIETESITASTGDELIVLATAVVIAAITATAKFCTDSGYRKCRYKLAIKNQKGRRVIYDLSLLIIHSAITACCQISSTSISATEALKRLHSRSYKAVNLASFVLNLMRTR